MLKKCTTCNIKKNNYLFIKNKNKCKECDNDRSLMKSYISKCKKYNILYNKGDHRKHKICKQCKLKKKIKLFNSKYSSICLSCRDKNKIETIKRFHINHPEYRKLQCKKYREKNKEKINKKAREYSKKPDVKRMIKERKRLYRKNNPDKFRNTIDSKLRHNISCCIRKAIRKNGTSLKDVLPYSINELKRHLENQFEPWMNWDNWGIYNSETWDDDDSSTWTWQIDHIIPQSEYVFDSIYDELLIKCWALDNLRPLSAKINILDGVSKKRHLNQ